ncbi:MAG: hypothetical protein ABFC67_14555 [Mizugakiibacter sp.]|uniref:hypothetical protein n=1 Tax=Mizugakiibacter sp. TaxID=1972610 RepID=UPI00320F8996
MNIFGSNTRAFPPALKHFFRCTERSGSVIYDDAGGVEWDPSVGGYSLAFDAEKSLGTVACLGAVDSGSKPVELKTGQFHTFAGNLPTMFMYAARKIIDPYAQHDTSVRDLGTAAARFAIGDINNLGTVNGTKYASPAGIGLAGAPFHHALGSHSANNVRIDCSTSYTNTTGDIAEPDAYRSSNLPWLWPKFLSYLDWKFSYDAYYPYRVSQAPILLPHGPDVLVVAVRDPSVSLYSYGAYDIAGGGRLLFAEAVTNGDTLATPFQPNPCMRIHNLALYGYAAFEFSSGLPSNWLTAAQWMGQRWMAGERVIYPKWEGLA